VQAGEAVAQEEAEAEVEANKKKTVRKRWGEVAYNIPRRWHRKRSAGSVRRGPLAAQWFQRMRCGGEGVDVAQAQEAEAEAEAEEGGSNSEC
jgi:hypothetical protein